MPTQAPKTLFDPDSIKGQAKPVLDIVNPLLAEVRNHGLALFSRCATRPEGTDENLVILFVFRHLLELLDSVSLQIAECGPAPATLQLRAMFEALLSLEYVVQDKSKTRQRAMAYLYKVELSRRQFYLSLRPKYAGG